MLFRPRRPWCEADANAKRLTFRAFPPWLYREPPASTAFLRQWNQQSAEIAGRVLLHRLGRMPARIAATATRSFTPPESRYDAARAAAHIHGDAPVPEGTQEADPATPALPWLTSSSASCRRGALKLVAFMPVNVAAQPRPGSGAAAREGRLQGARRRDRPPRGAVLVDFRIPSAVTREDTNYWTPSTTACGRRAHRRRLAPGGGRAARRSDGFYRVLAAPRAAER